jgi:thiol-disulfide isomerase/thioredoxin
MKRKQRLTLAVTTVVLLSAPAFAAAPAEIPAGLLSREQVEAIVRNWGTTVVINESWNARVDEIRHVAGGATIKVFMGVWCEDSRQEIPQFMKILDTLDGKAPFAVEFYAVDERKEQPAHELEANAVWYVPTFIVLRNGREVGRIVEHPARTLEKDLLRLLNGSAKGLLSSSEGAIVRYISSEAPARDR